MRDGHPVDRTAFCRVQFPYFYMSSVLIPRISAEERASEDPKDFVIRDWQWCIVTMSQTAALIDLGTRHPN